MQVFEPKVSNFYENVRRDKSPVVELSSNPMKKYSWNKTNGSQVPVRYSF